MLLLQKRRSFNEIFIFRIAFKLINLLRVHSDLMIDLFEFCLHLLVSCLELDNLLGKGALVLLQSFKFEIILVNFFLELIFVPHFMSKFLIIMIFILLFQSFVCLYSILDLQQHSLDLFFLN